MLQLLNPAAAAAIALIPGVFVLLLGLRLARLVDDPVFPERLLSSRTQKQVILGLAIGLLISIGSEHLRWAVPLLILGRMAAAYPLRKTLYEETWSLGGYLSFFLRLIIASFSFWIVIGLAPILVMLAGARDWIAALALAATLLVWNDRMSGFVRSVLGATPVVDSGLISRFAELLKKTGLTAVALEQVPLRGGVFANAAALPSIRRPAVLVSETLTARFDQDETIAILGHELAHLEHFNPRFLTRSNLVTRALVIVGTMLTPVLRIEAPAALAVVPALWPVAVALTLGIRGRHRQNNETSSDLRAIALTGDPDALVRALSKLHAFARVPRRWDAAFERHATHPSLARRIQAIRGAAGAAATALGEPATFHAPDHQASVTFYEDHVSWSGGRTISSTSTPGHIIRYDQLTELRIAARTSGAPRLIAVDVANRRWESVLHRADIARAQAVLDIVDGRLAAAAPPPAISPAVTRLVAAALMIGCLMAGQGSGAIAAWLSVVWPSSPLIAAAGAGALGAAGLTWRDRAAWQTTTMEPWGALVVLLTGFVLLGIAVANRRDRVPRVVSRLIVGLTLLAVIVWAFLLSPGLSAIDVHQGARDWPAAAVLTMALAGALMFVPSRAARFAAVPLTLAALLVAFCGSTGFLDRFARDPFLPASGELTVKTIDAPILKEFSVPFEVREAWLSPDGQHLALQEEHGKRTSTIHAGRVGSPLTAFTADAAMFVSDGGLLLLEWRRGASLLQLVDLDRGNIQVWSHELPLFATRLSVDHASRTWRLLGWNDDEEIVSAEGGLATEPIEEHVFESPAADIDDVEALAVSGGDVLALETHDRSARGSANPLAQWASSFGSRSRTESRFWALGAHGRSAFADSRLELWCFSAFSNNPALCTAFDGSRTGVFAVDVASRRSDPLASLAGHFYARRDAGRGWLSGWWDGGSILCRPSTREALRVRRLEGRDASLLTISDSLLAAVWAANHESTVRLYAIGS